MDWYRLVKITYEVGTTIIENKTTTIISKGLRVYMPQNNPDVVLIMSILLAIITIVIVVSIIDQKKQLGLYEKIREILQIISHIIVSLK